MNLYADLHVLTVVGTCAVRRDSFGRFFVDEARVVIARDDGLFTTLRCADRRTRFVMTADWRAAQRLPPVDSPEVA